MYDIVIIGLGPAGATLARLLSRERNVAAIDKKTDGDSGFHKPCGGLLAPDAQKALARFDLTLPKELLVDPQIFSVRTVDLDSGLTRYYQRFYMNIDRQKLDHWLISLIPPAVDLFRDTECVKIERSESAFTLTLRRGGGLQTIQSRVVVGADGANSLVRRTFFPKKKIRRYAAIQQWFREQNANPFYSCVFDSKNTDCYSWSISKDGYFIFGGAYPLKDCRARFEHQKAALAEQGFHFGEPLKTEACQVLRPASPFQFCTGEENVFLIGEAAGFVSPSSLEGISSGVNSACILSRVLNGGKGAASYRRGTLPLRLKLAGKLLKCPFLFCPGLRMLVMKSRLQSIRVEDRN